MTGFPGETEEDFGLLLDFLREARLENAGFFRFSPEEGTPAARLSGRIPGKLAEKRLRKLHSAQKKISRAFLKGLVGTELEVISEGPSEDSPLVYSGRAVFQAPEVDGLVYFEGVPPEAGSIVTARVISAGDYDLAVAVP